MSEEQNEKTADKPEGEKPVELVDLKINGEPVKLPKGKNLLQAILDEGHEISYFCYHPQLSISACCRQCMVSVGGRLVPSCQTEVAPDMDVVVDSEEALQARREMLRFTLLNHPVDCPICDKAGECALQRHYMDWDSQPSMVNHEKVHKPKKVDLGPEIVLDAERCILCSRCIRFCAEIAKSPQLVFSMRANHTTISTAPGEKLDNPYSLNTVDICPVGALTDKDFRFQIRVWELWATMSICNGCAAGCPLEIHHHGGEIYRLVPRKRHDVNLNWMCNTGRRTYKTVQEERITSPLIDGKAVDLDPAINAAKKLLAPLIPEQKKEIGVVLGADTANEDCFAAARLAFDFLETEHVYLADKADDGSGDEILRSNDPNPNRAGAIACGRGALKTIEELSTDVGEGKLKALYVVTDRLELSDETIHQLANLPVVVQATRPSRLTRGAKVVLPAACWPEVDATITNEQKTVQRMRQAIEPPGFARPHWDLCCRVAKALGLGVTFARAEKIFDEMKTQLPAFAEADWGEKIPTMRLRFAHRRG